MKSWIKFLRFHRQQYGRAGCIPFHCQQYGRAGSHPFHCQQNGHEGCTPFHHQKYKSVYHHHHQQHVDMQGVYISTTSSMGTLGVPLSTASSMGVQGVYISTTSNMDAQVYPIPPPKVGMCRVYSFPPTSSVGMQGFPFPPQCECSGCTFLLMPGAGLSGILSVWFKNGQKCWCRKQFGTGIRGLSLVPECSGTILKYRMPGVPMPVASAWMPMPSYAKFIVILWESKPAIAVG